MNIFGFICFPGANNFLVINETSIHVLTNLFCNSYVGIFFADGHGPSSVSFVFLCYSNNMSDSGRISVISGVNFDWTGPCPTDEDPGLVYIVLEGVPISASGKDMLTALFRSSRPRQVEIMCRNGGLTVLIGYGCLVEAEMSLIIASLLRITVIDAHIWCAFANSRYIW